MDIPIQYYIFIGAGVLIAAGLLRLLVRRRAGRKPVDNPYVEALKMMIDQDKEGAFQALQRAVKSGSAPTDAYIRLGNLLRERGEGQKALQIHQSLTVKTTLTKLEKKQLFLGMAEDHAALGNSEKAIKVLENAIHSLQLRSPGVFATLAKHYHLLGHHDKAYEALKESKRHGGIGDRELALYLASAAEQVAAGGDTRSARKMLQRALRRDSKSAPAIMALADLALADGATDEAIAGWKQVALLSPQLSESALHKLERTLYDAGRFSDIEKVYSAVRTARNGDEGANLSLAAYYRKQGRGEDAIQLLEDYLTVYPESVRGSLLLTSFYAKHRDEDTLDRFLDESFSQSGRAAHYHCTACDFRSDRMRWHCPRCNKFDSFSSPNEI